MSKAIRAIYEGGVFHPLDAVDLKDKVEVMVTVESGGSLDNNSTATDDPLAGISFSSGIDDLSRRFDDYRFGKKV